MGRGMGGRRSGRTSSSASASSAALCIRQRMHASCRRGDSSRNMPHSAGAVACSSAVSRCAAFSTEAWAIHSSNNLNIEGQNRRLPAPGIICAAIQGARTHSVLQWKSHTLSGSGPATSDKILFCFFGMRSRFSAKSVQISQIAGAQVVAQARIECSAQSSIHSSRSSASIARRSTSRHSICNVCVWGGLTIVSRPTLHLRCFQMLSSVGLSGIASRRI